MADWNCNLCKEYQSGIACTYCNDGSKFARMSQADRIRNMTDEELAEFASLYVGCGYCDAGTISGDCSAHCKENLLKWLQSEAE